MSVTQPVAPNAALPAGLVARAAANAPMVGQPQLTREEVVARVRELPPLPAVVMEVTASLNNEASSISLLAGQIARDTALAAKTLRLANSSLYGMPRQVTSIGDAAAVLGVRTLRGVLTAAGIAGSFKSPACPAFNFQAFWRDTIGTALCARKLAQGLRMDEEAAFTAGLLHDIGRLALASCFPAHATAVLDHQRLHGCPALEAERAVLATDHSVIGALIAEHWRFAPAIVGAIADHHEPPSAAAATLTDIVHVADNMAHALDFSRLEDDVVPPLAMAAWIRLKLDERKCHAIFASTESELDAVCSALFA